MLMPDPDQTILARRADIVEALRRIVPGNGVIAERAGMSVYESDGLTAYRQLPLVVVLPETVDQLLHGIVPVRATQRARVGATDCLSPATGIDACACG